MFDLLLAPLLAFAFCAILIPLVRAIANRCGLVDRPDGRRKLHDRVVPLAGGVAILLAGIAALTITLALSPSLLEQSTATFPSLAGLLVSSVLICAVGVLDDFGRLRGREKLLGQAMAAGIVIMYGVRIEGVQLFGHSFELGALAIPFTLFVLLGAINSLNLMDGMDGLLGGIGLIICLALGAMAVLSGKAVPGCVALTLAGALLGFLVYNFPPATIFLGDAGSMVIGLTVGVLAIQGSLKGPATVALAAPTALLILPIFDTTAAILRRKLTGRSIYTTDRGHLHHCLLRRGLTVHWALLVVALCCLVTVAGTLASLFFKNEMVALLSAAVVVVMLIVTRSFGHAELRLVAQKARGLFRSLLDRPSRGSVRELKVHLQGSLAWQEVWLRLIDRSDELNLCRVRLDVNAPAINEGYHASWARGGEITEAGSLWRAEMPLTVLGKTIGRMVVAGLPDESPIKDKLAILAILVHECESAAFDLMREASLAASPTPPAYRVVPRPTTIRAS
jgi:UDP-GlcNAc:undecaprenyl-phosphate GlcNAc-1-phosphate transferase